MYEQAHFTVAFRKFIDNLQLHVLHLCSLVKKYTVKRSCSVCYYPYKPSVLVVGHRLTARPKSDAS